MATKKKSSSARKSSSRGKSTGSKTKSSTKHASSTSRKSNATKKSSSKKSSRKYSPAAGRKVKEEMHEMKRGKLKTGSGKKVTSRKQAIAIGLSEARRAGKKVPSKKS
jgi:Family of unknown function (DUF6496)